MVGIENRRDYRAPISLPVRYFKSTRLGGPPLQVLDAFTTDISSHGLGLRLNEPLDEGDQLNIQITIPFAPYKAEGTVRTRWIRDSYSESYYAGLEFSRFPPDVAEAVLDYWTAV